MDATHRNIKVYTGLDAREGAALALTHRLFVSGWTLNGILGSIKDGRDVVSRLALSFVDGAPVAVVVHVDQRFYRGHVMAFCKVPHRRKGHGSACAQALYCDGLKASVGTVGSHDFWIKNGVSLTH